MTQPHYKILNLHAENVKKLKVVDITPDPENNTVIISGKNGQGKTSVLDSIYWALAGKDKIQDKPIRDGEEKAFIQLDLGEYIVKRTFTEKDTYLSVENQDGFKTTSPQKMLDDLLGTISFDPLAFTRQDRKSQYRTLRNLVKLDVDIDELDALNKKDFDERTLVNREAKNLEAQLGSYANLPEGVPDTPIDVSELVRNRDAIQTKMREKQALETQIAQMGREIEVLEQQIRDKKADMHAKKELLGSENFALDPARLEYLQNQIDESSTLNGHVSAKQTKVRIDGELAEKKKLSENYTANIEKRNKQKTEALERAEFPVPGLSFDGGEILFNGLPFDQASNAEQIRVSTAIAMAMNPKIRVLRIKDGSLLDDDSMTQLRTMAKEHDFQVWIEVVSSDDPVAVIIEEGEIKN